VLRNCIGRRLHRSYNLKDPTFNLRNVMPSFSTLADRCGGKTLIRLFALLLALAVSTPVLLAQDWDHDHLNGRDKVHDPTGAWLIRNDAEGSPFILTVFHKGGTLTGDLQGEGAFDPAATKPPLPPLNVINSPESGVWQKTGWKTFAVTFLTIEYQVDPPNATFYQFDKVQFTGFLNESGDRMEITEAVITNFNSKGQLIGEPNKISSKAHGVRIPLEVLPKSSDTLPIPQPPQ
jgi:hypothetical protein